MSGSRAARNALYAVLLVSLSAWIGFSTRFSTAVPGAQMSAPLLARVRHIVTLDDDLDVKAHELHDLHDLPSPEAIRAGDWSAGGRFSRRPPQAFADHAGAYPPTRPLTAILDAWNPDNVSIPFPFAEALAVLNYSVPAERLMAEAYRDAEVPFKVFGVPDIEAVRRSWTDAYLLDNIDGRRGVQFKVERSQNNHFMYWTHKSNVQRKFPGWKSPTQILSGTKFKTWLGWAKAADASRAGPDAPHHYLMMGTAPLSEQLRRTSDHFVTRDLPMFVPREAKGNFFVTRPSANKGVQCRFGMRGVIAEAHYDGGRNMVAMLKGAKRYVLSPPSACGRLGLIADRSHPSFRHSTTDWSDPAEAETAFAAPDAVAVDTVLREGEVLYIPSFWVHYIVSLRYSVQCNTRSGFPPRGEGEDYVNDCMGKTPANDARETAGAAERRGGKHHKLRGGAN